MNLRVLFLALGVLFAGIGVVFWGVGGKSHFEESTWVWTQGRVEHVAFQSSQKLGRSMSLEIQGNPTTFGLALLDRVEGLEPKLRAALESDEEVRIGHIDWVDPDGHAPTAVMAIEKGGARIFDQSELTGSIGKALPWIARGMGTLSILVGALLVTMSVRLKNGLK
ncbi:MAG: hypothetical protein R3F17_02730 [Planctomycetota bacterium]